MYKKILLLSVMPFYLAQSTKPDLKTESPHKDGRGCDVARYAGVGLAQELAKHDKLPDLEKVSTGLARDVGATAIKSLTEIAAAPTTKALTDDIGKNTGSTAAKALAEAAVTSTTIVAGVVVAAGAAYAANKVIDRYFPDEQEKANRAEASIRTFTATSTVEDMTTERAQELSFIRCLNLHPKQVRNSLGCPANCQNHYRSLSLLGRHQAVVEQLNNLKKADDHSILTLSADDAEKQVQKSFEENKNDKHNMYKISAWTEKGWFSWWYGTKSYDLEIPKKSVDLLVQVAPLSPKRFSKILAEKLQERYSNVQACEAPIELDKNGYPKPLKVHVTIDGQRVVNRRS